MRDEFSVFGLTYVSYDYKPSMGGHFESPGHILSSEGLIACHSYSGQSLLVHLESITDTFDHHLHSCIRVRQNLNHNSSVLIKLSSDAYGAVPLYYSTHRVNGDREGHSAVIATDDLDLAKELNFTSVVILKPSQVVTLSAGVDDSSFEDLDAMVSSHSSSTAFDTHNDQSTVKLGISRRKRVVDDDIDNESSHSTAPSVWINQIKLKTASPDLDDSLLRDTARAYANTGGEIVVILATVGYKDLLRNFLCSVQRPTVRLSNILLITPDEELVDVAREAGIGYYRAQLLPSLVSQQGRSNSAISSCLSCAKDFGSLQYQELMLLRTGLVMRLLELGYNPLIADIDTVWLRNPFPYIHQVTHSPTTGSPVDVYVTMDGETNICGCFLFFRNSTGSLLFWAEVLQQHRQLVMEARSAPDGLLKTFDESEQIIITRLLLNKEYKLPLAVYVLPTRWFPSGLDYFNRRTHLALTAEGDDEGPLLVHNNFVIGLRPKISRFQR